MDSEEKSARDEWAYDMQRLAIARDLLLARREAAGDAKMVLIKAGDIHGASLVSEDNAKRTDTRLEELRNAWRACAAGKDWRACLTDPSLSEVHLDLVALPKDR